MTYKVPLTRLAFGVASGQATLSRQGRGDKNASPAVGRGKMVVREEAKNRFSGRSDRSSEWVCVFWSPTFKESVL